MEPWAKFILEDRADGSSVSIRLASAYKSLRDQPSLSLASNRQIKHSLWKKSKKENLGFRKPTEGKYSYWPPENRADFEENSFMRSLMKPEEIQPTPKEYYSQWSCGWLGDVYGPESGPESLWVTVGRGPDGLPDKEEWCVAVWENTIVAACKKDKSLPLPPYPWAKFRLRLLSPKRIANAVRDLPWRCILCGGDGDGKQNGLLQIGWIVGHRDFKWEYRSTGWDFDDLIERQNYCFECYDLLENLRSSRERGIKPDGVYKQVIARQRQEMMPKRVDDAPKRRRRLTKSERVEEALAVRSALIELGLINEGELL